MAVKLSKEEIKEAEELHAQRNGCSPSPPPVPPVKAPPGAWQCRDGEWVWIEDIG